MFTHSLLPLWAALTRGASQRTITTTAEYVVAVFICALCAFCAAVPIFVLLHETAHVAAAVATNRFWMAFNSVTVSTGECHVRHNDYARPHTRLPRFLSVCSNRLPPPT